MTVLFGGIALDSEFAFDQIEVRQDQTPRLQISLCRGVSVVTDSRSATETIVHRAAGRYQVTLSQRGNDAAPHWIFRSRFPDVFVFDPVRHRIDCHIASTDAQIWQDVLLRRVIPRVANFYGAIVLHAAAVANDDGCLLFLGPSGAGKSTLTAYCATKDWQVLAEDAAFVWPQTAEVSEKLRRFSVEPVQRGIGIWDVTREALRLPEESCCPMPGYDGRKWWFYPTRSTAASKASPLSAILIPERSASTTKPVLNPVASDVALRWLYNQSISFLPGAQPSATSARTFGRIAGMARSVPCFTLTYPDGFDLLPYTEQLMRTLLSKSI